MESNNYVSLVFNAAEQGDNALAQRIEGLNAKIAVPNLHEIWCW